VDVFADMAGNVALVDTVFLGHEAIGDFSVFLRDASTIVVNDTAYTLELRSTSTRGSQANKQIQHHAFERDCYFQLMITSVELGSNPLWHQYCSQEQHCLI